MKLYLVKHIYHGKENEGYIRANNPQEAKEKLLYLLMGCAHSIRVFERVDINYSHCKARLRSKNEVCYRLSNE